MRRVLALSATLLLGACDTELNHLLNYDDARRDHARAAAQAPAAPPAEPPREAATAPPARAGAPPPQPVALTPVESPNMAFCRNVAEGDARNDFDAATHRAQYDRSLAQCLAIQGN